MIFTIFFSYLGDFLLKQRHPIVMLSWFYLKNLVHLCYYYQYLELPVVWIPQAKNSLPLLKGQSLAQQIAKSHSWMWLLGTKGFWATMHPLWLSCVDGDFHSCCCWSSCNMMFVLVLYSWICCPFLWLTIMMPRNI